MNEKKTNKQSNQQRKKNKQTWSDWQLTDTEHQTSSDVFFLLDFLKIVQGLYEIAKDNLKFPNIAEESTNTLRAITILIIKITISSIVIGLKKLLFSTYSLAKLL